MGLGFWIDILRETSISCFDPETVKRTKNTPPNPCTVRISAYLESHMKRSVVLAAVLLASTMFASVASAEDAPTKWLVFVTHNGIEHKIEVEASAKRTTQFDSRLISWHCGAKVVYGAVMLVQCENDSGNQVQVEQDSLHGTSVNSFVLAEQTLHGKDEAKISLVYAQDR